MLLSAVSQALKPDTSLSLSASDALWESLLCMLVLLLRQLLLVCQVPIAL